MRELRISISDLFTRAGSDCAGSRRPPQCACCGMRCKMFYVTVQTLDGYRYGEKPKPLCFECEKTLQARAMKMAGETDDHSLWAYTYVWPAPPEPNPQELEDLEASEGRS